MLPNRLVPVPPAAPVPKPPPVEEPKAPVVPAPAVPKALGCDVPLVWPKALVAGFEAPNSEFPAAAPKPEV